MAKFAKTYPDFEFVQTVSAQISWSHNTALLDKVKDDGQRAWYAKKAIEDGWTLSTLEYQIEYRLYERQVLALCFLMCVVTSTGLCWIKANCTKTW